MFYGYLYDNLVFEVVNKLINHKLNVMTAGAMDHRKSEVIHEFYGKLYNICEQT